MMTYTAPDGHIIESLPYPECVQYICTHSEISNGTYESIETTSADTPIGIQQIRIKREILNNFMTITIRMSSDQELIDYINQNKPTE